MVVTELTIPRFKHRLRLTIVFLLCAVIGLAAWGIWQDYRESLRFAERQTEGYARVLAEHSQSAFSESDRVLRDVLHDLRKAGGIKKVSLPEWHQELRRQAGSSPQIGALFMVDRQGTMFLNSHEYPRTVSVADRDYFRYYQTTPGAELSISRPVMSRLVNRWRFNLMRPLNQPGQPFDGILAVAFEMDYFKRFITPDSLGKQGRIALIRTDGVPLLFEPYYDKVYQTDFKETVLFREKLPRAGNGTFHVGPNHNTIDKSPRIISYRQLDRFPVVAVVSVDRSEVLAPWRTKALVQSGLTLGLCLTVLLLTRLLMGHLDRLKRAQEALTRQRQEARIKAAQVDAAHDGILMVTINGYMAQVNNAICRMTGYSAEELQGKPLSYIEPPEFMQKAEENLAMVWQWREATFESAYLTKVGAFLPVEVSAQVVESDGTSYILGIVRDISERKRNQRREQTKAILFERLATGANLQQLLNHIVQYVEEEREQALCSVLLADEDLRHLRHGAAPSLPDSYNRAVDGLVIAKGKGACGTAAFLRKRVITEDISRDPHWKGFAPVVEAGLRACWSEPVISASGDLLGTFAMYHRQPCVPGSNEIQLMETAAHLASIAIDRFRSQEQRSRLESQLHHVQRVEAVGQLAGGIAHDFNNLLTPILGYAEMIKQRVPQGDVLAERAQGIIRAAGKARDLTQQLLSFGRKQMLNLQSLDLNEIVGSFYDILRRTIRENIAIDFHPACQALSVRADRGQIEQILINLAVNAQDAIAGNGTITMETGQVVLDSEYARLHPGLQPGRYALLSFQDSGKGMDENVLSHIFEPFFTTKEVGHGTGLGLATVYGLVKQHEGYIAVSSRVGEGTVFNIYLPLGSGQTVVTLPESSTADLPEAVSGNRTVLLVEDNEMVRSMAVELLQGAGYVVLDAELPSVALQLVQQRTRQIDLLVTDVMMPEMNGGELYERLILDLPDLRVLYISGYATGTIVHKGALEEDISFLQKPFTAERFLKAVQHALAQQE